MMLGIMWTFQVIAFILVGLRLYTRLVVVHNYGIDDHFFNFTVVSTFHFYEALPVTRFPLLLFVNPSVRTMATGSLLRSKG